MINETGSLTGPTALFLGLFMVASGLGMAINPAARAHMMQEFRRSRFLQYVSGLFAFIIGTLVIWIVPMGPGLLSILLAVTGWVMLAKGVLLLIWPDMFTSLSHKMSVKQFAILGWVTTAAGFLLFLAGNSVVDHAQNKTAATAGAVQSQPVGGQTPKPTTDNSGKTGISAK